jgi:hypothetical protein
MYKRYVEEIRRELGLHAAWPVETPVRLGDIGVFHDGLFQRTDSLESRGIKFKRRIAKANASLEYHSSNGTKIESKLLASAPGASDAAKIGYVVRFHGENAAFVTATKCSFTEIEDQELLGIEILQQYRGGFWSGDHVVVTNVIESDNATILVSSTDDGLAEFVLPKTDPVIIDGDAKLVSQHGLAVKVTAGKGVTPFFRTRGIARKWLLGQPRFLDEKVTQEEFTEIAPPTTDRTPR